MLLVGLTGGIGSGKSTVARMLTERGAVVIDADALGRAAVAEGTPGHARIVEVFGEGVLGTDGEIDRQALADVVFADPARRADLEAIVHPEVQHRFAQMIERYRDTDRVVVYDAPLIVEVGLQRAFDVLIVVTAPVETQVGRLVERGMEENDARARIAAQLPMEQKAAVADELLDNEGTLEDLEGQVERLWSDLSARAGV